MTPTSNRRIAVVATSMLALDQVTKFVVNQCLVEGGEKVLIPGFFKFVNWKNTGAAWSLFTGKNFLLVIVALVALYILARSRHHFEVHTGLGQISLGLIFGGITGNLLDRIFAHRVTDFIYFYMDRRGGGQIGFPAFNVADSAICIGVALIFILSWREDKLPAAPAQPTV